MKKSLISLGIGAALLSGCSLIPDYERPAAPIENTWPQGKAYEGNPSTTSSKLTADIGWREFYNDRRLQQLIQIALENNRDLRQAALNVQLYQAQYRIQRADLFPQIGVNGNGTRSRTPADMSTMSAIQQILTGQSSSSGSIGSQYTVTLGVTSYELDLFGRLRSLSEQALQSYFATAEAQRSTQITLISEVANAYFTWLTDQHMLQLTRDTLQAYQRSYDLTRSLLEHGAGSGLDLRQARTALEGARANLAQYTRQEAQDRNALTLLLGAPLPSDLAKDKDLNDSDLLAPLPAGLPSNLLQRRPDILQAELNLKAANANIGAARAAFFPSISLTAQGGTGSSELSGLFEPHSGYWTFAPSINIPIFTAGSLKASLDAAKIQKDINVAAYEGTIQTAFREVSDALAAQGTYDDQLQAQRDLVKASQEYYDLADKRYRQGIDDYLTVLDAQRSLYTAQEQLLTDRLNQLVSTVTLYKALGGGWLETTELTPVNQPKQ
ncbi:multidrug efflux system outer membrane protein [Pseudomonas duriflava]|uniref:Multidrug efflux system outer membrane protein n=1 Tax=Pseudomonas duriflava TaxID=459528 RepID=A0A562QFR8_9PSED|nr:AdeC/AdeK/OprM family multidrug efflux complex outer membrane factor [Pseudomonas duriflava]TWI54876.1 multidrug efflux system outer membrane protein [Pseudomonas duriflava]